MKTSSDLARVVATSHRRITRVDLHEHDGTLVQSGLPVTAGTITGSAVDQDRWRADLVLAGDLWVPLDPTGPLSGLAKHYLAVWMGAEVDGTDVLIEVCRVVPTTTRARVSATSVDVDTTCLGPMGWLAAASGSWTPTASETCQDMIERIVTDTDPPAWDGTVTDTTTPVTVPSDYEGGDTAGTVIEDLAAIANIAVYFDALGTLTMRDPLESTFETPDVWLAQGSNLTGYDVETGREFGFANRVELTFRKPDGTEVLGTAEQTSGDLGTGTVGTVTYREQRDGNVSGTVANNRAAALLDTALLAWQTTAVDAVPDPRVEPDDYVGVNLLDRTRYGRVTTVELPVGMDAMRVGLRTFLDLPLFPAVDLYPNTALYPAGG